MLLACLVLPAGLLLSASASSRTLRRHKGHRPVLRTLPAISGIPSAGHTLRASPGRWYDAVELKYRWLSCDRVGRRCHPIAHLASRRCTHHHLTCGNSSHYRLTPGDVGHTMRVIVIATNGFGRASATSKPTAVITNGATGSGGGGSPTGTPSPPGTPLPPGSGLHVSGNRLLDANGNPVQLRGVDRSGTESACVQNAGIFSGNNAYDDANPIKAISTWKGVNTVFYGLNEDCWLGINGVPAKMSGTAYQNAIKAAVQEAEAAGLYPVIGFFWGAGATTLATSQPPMPDNDHTPLFWQQVANTFKNDPHVIFRLQEEPHPYNGDSLSAWKCWSQGDVSYDTSNTLVPTGHPNACAGQTGFTNGAVGMQSLINIIRGTGARNVIQVPGNQWAGEVQCSSSTTVPPNTCGFLDSADGIEVHDTLNPSQLMADLDIYMENDGPNVNPTAWANELAPVARVMPLEAGELNEDVNMASTNITPLQNFLAWADTNQVGYYLWAWNSWSYNDVLVTGVDTGTPKAPVGTMYKAHVAAF